MVLVDSCVLIDLLTDDEYWKGWSQSVLEEQADNGEELVINPVIYSEISMTFDKPEDLDKVLDDMMIAVRDMPRQALFDAARAHVQYKRNGGTKTQTLPDFFIGAHAQAEKIKLITRDVKRFQTYFPVVELISPPQDMLFDVAKKRSLEKNKAAIDYLRDK